mmetsp:Transcript_8065/g.15188  ORF Transcript_8065/g.15188 Transcript_8065/m.15188 type:complete len:398 (-) Transcript_8065:656-1849(-)
MKLCASVLLAVLVPGGHTFTLHHSTQKRYLGCLTTPASRNPSFIRLSSNVPKDVLEEENNSGDNIEKVEPSVEDDIMEEQDDKTKMSNIDQKPEFEVNSSSSASEMMGQPTEEKQSSHLVLQKMLMIASSTDRGQFASKEQKQSMGELISQLESMYISNSAADQPTRPADSKEIQGTWELIYSNTQLFRSSPFFMAGRAVCQTEEEAQRYDWFCDMHRAALAISEIGKVRQIISSDRLVSEFEVNVGAVPFLSDFTPLKYSGGLPFTINGAIVSSADITPTNEGTAWQIFMDKVEIKGSNIPLLRRILDDERVALQSRSLGSFLEENVSGYKNPRPIFKTTYLDDSIRISRDQDGKVFVYGKMSEETEPTEYKNIEADFSLLNLLEGLNDNFFKFSI